MTDEEFGVASKYQLSDEIWRRNEPLPHPPKSKKKLGRPRTDSRKVISAAFDVLSTGCQ